MKIGILTLPLHTNYGGILQAYALSAFLINKGHEIYLINLKHKRANNPIFNLYSYLGRFIKYRLILKEKKKIDWYYYPTEKDYSIISQNIRPFIDRYIPRTIEIENTKKDFSKLETYQFEAYVVGSDQCWRPSYSSSISRYFLDFLEKKSEIIKISYAASFGNDFWEFSERQTHRCKKLIQQFNAVSVREKSGVKLCQQFFLTKATHLIDPTLLLKEEDYNQLIENTPSKKEECLMIYILDNNPLKKRVVNKMLDMIELKPIFFMPKQNFLYTGRKGIYESIYPSIEEWLSCFRDCKYVITDSYHGTIFSIIYNKPFIVIGNQKRGMGRFLSLLKMFNLEKRIIVTESDLTTDLPFTPIDYKKINQTRKNEVNKSISFIDKYLKK